MSVNVKDRIRAQVEKALSASPVNPASYSSAATFYYEWDKDLDKALSNINKATEANPKAFWLYLQQARIQKDLGDKVSATASAQKCVELATEAKNNDYVRMANDLIKGL
jgi:tetratricopeptide (TPR) repeat protein